MEEALQGALERGEFHLRFQPEFEIKGSLAALEVLLSWRHPRLGRVPAEQFIHLAEDTGLIIPIGAWVLQQACRQSVSWQRRGAPAVKLAVNVSPLQVAQADFVDLVAGALSDTGLPASLLELEVTESALMMDIRQSAKMMARVRRLGVGFSIDDFGTGYSSLSYLRRLPATTLKIDRSFLEDLGSTNSSLNLVETIVRLAHGLGLSVVGEGVETREQFELLRLTGCDRVQGHLFGQPLTAADARRLLVGKQRLTPHS
jgi:EAL domain-containing protein (putative c-di-GMP-specific phosphodiesterase class I)